MPTEVRIKRIQDRIRQDLSEMIVMQKIHDPRINGATITEVKVDRELSYADIFVSAVEGHLREQEIMEGLQSASGFIRRTLSKQIQLRVFPRIRFHWDPTPERADHIEQLLAQIRKDEPPTNE